MKKVDKEELKKIQLEMLNYVSDYCDENNISYFLTCGTLLGAVRHRGYIPWDDDIDIAMLRTDYDRFIHSFNVNNKSNFRCYSVENNDNYLFPFAKVINNNTILYEPNEKGFKHCINIDVFVYDNAPSNNKDYIKMYKKRDLYEYLNRIRAFHHLSSKKSLMSSFVKHFLYPFLLLFPKNYFTKKIVKNSKKFQNIETDYVGNFMSITKIKCLKKWFSSTIDLDFEGKKYHVPKYYDEFLREFYGDYMSLPPKEKQVSHHTFVAYTID